MAGASLLADLIQQKYAFHLSFYRQIQQFKQLGVKLSSSTINDWYSASANLLEPLYDLVKREVLASDYIQMDETVLTVIDKSKHMAAKRYMWVAHSPEKNLVFFDYDKGSRSSDAAIKILDGYKGYLQCDGYGAYGKNFLFCGNHNSAKNTAIMFTLINSCKHNDVNIREWLTHIMTKLPYMTQSKEDLHSLLPANWKQISKGQE